MIQNGYKAEQKQQQLYVISYLITDPSDWLEKDNTATSGKL